MLAQVVSRIRLHFRRSKARIQQPPDLRRFSDFENPFPRVSPGGYTKYYEEHGVPKPRPLPAGTLASASSSTIVISAPKPRVLPSTLSIPTPPSQSSPSSSSYSQSSPSLISASRKGRRTLSIIREGSASSIASSPSMHMLNLSNTPSLRRRRARLLRTPSVELHFPATAPKMTLFAGGSPASDESEFSSNDSSQSHPSRTDDSMNTPPTTIETIEEDGPLLFKTEVARTYERPESMSSYVTARSNFSTN